MNPFFAPTPSAGPSSISQKKLEANRRNARKSTGPASARGRAISSQNGRKHELLPLENPALPAQLTAQYYGYFIPANKTERRLVDALIHADRLRRHFLALESHALAREIRDVELASIPAALSPASRRKSTLPRRLDFAQCAARNALRQLDALRAKAA